MVTTMVGGGGSRYPLAHCRRRNNFYRFWIIQCSESKIIFSFAAHKLVSFLIQMAMPCTTSVHLSYTPHIHIKYTHCIHKHIHIGCVRSVFVCLRQNRYWINNVEKLPVHTNSIYIYIYIALVVLRTIHAINVVTSPSNTQRIIIMSRSLRVEQNHETNV